MVYRLYRKQLLNTDIDDAWSYFSSANNLPEISPKNMKFTVLTQLENDILFKGMLIDYTVAPLFNIPLRWQTEIIHVKPQHSFIDFQKKGPFKLWRHEHIFTETSQGLLMEDILQYELPLGFLGILAHKWMVRKKIGFIFDYRAQVIHQKFNVVK